MPLPAPHRATGPAVRPSSTQHVVAPETGAFRLVEPLEAPRPIVGAPRAWGPLVFLVGALVWILAEILS